MLNDFLNDKPTFLGKPVNSPSAYLKTLLCGDFIGANVENIVTQKAKGVFFLQDTASKVLKFGWKVPKHLLFKAGEEFSDGSFNYPVFARPCPTVPRHGFVDSLPCKNAVELNVVSNLTKSAEADAEILITKPIDSSYSAIITGGVITFATGNDGATSGKGVKYFYIGDDPITSAICLPKEIILEGEVPFYEIVVSKLGEVNLVQCRSAPGIPPVKDFIPHALTVVNIIKAGGDLLEWEHKLTTVDPSTTIIDHVGGSLASHFAIHAIINKVPIFTTYCPKVGDYIEPTVLNSDIVEIDIENFKQGFRSGFEHVTGVISHFKKKSNIDVMIASQGILQLSLATLHNFNSISLNKDYTLLGTVLGLFTRVCFAVSKGEARYARNNGYVVKNNVYAEIEKYLLSIPQERGECYQSMLSLNPEKAIEEIVEVYKIFNNLSWSGGGFGGKNWANCTRSALNLYNFCVTGNIKDAVKQFNTVINENHNGGKYLNKLINVSQFDEAANNPSEYTLKMLNKIFEILCNIPSSQVSDDSIFKHLNYSLEANISSKIKLMDIEYDSLTVSQVNTVKKIVTVCLKSGNDKQFICIPYSSATDMLGAQNLLADTSKVKSLYSGNGWWVSADGSDIISKAKLTLALLKAKSSQDSTEGVSVPDNSVVSNPEQAINAAGVDLDKLSDILAKLKASTASISPVHGYYATNTGEIIAGNQESITNMFKYKVAKNKS